MPQTHLTFRGNLKTGRHRLARGLAKAALAPPLGRMAAPVGSKGPTIAVIQSAWTISLTSTVNLDWSGTTFLSGQPASTWMLVQ